MNVCSIWPFAQISNDFCYLDIWQCARYFVAALFKELALIRQKQQSQKCEFSGLGLELPGLSLGLGFYDKVSVSSQNLSQVSVSVSEVTVLATSLPRTRSAGRYPIQNRNRPLSCTGVKIFGSVYFASWGNSTAGALLPLEKHNCLKRSWQVQNA